MAGATMRINERIVDQTETFIRDPRGPYLKHLLLGCPITGIVIGIMAYGVTELLSLVLGFYAQLGAILLVPMALILCDRGTRRIREPVGDWTNRGLTRVFNFPWIPNHLRPVIDVSWEPWRTAGIVSLLLLSFPESLSPIITLPTTISGQILASAALGALITFVRGLMSKETLRIVLR